MRWYLIEQEDGVPPHVILEAPDYEPLAMHTTFIDPVIVSRTEALADERYAGALVAWERADDSAYWQADKVAEAEVIADHVAMGGDPDELDWSRGRRFEG